MTPADIGAAAALLDRKHGDEIGASSFVIRFPSKDRALEYRRKARAHDRILAALRGLLQESPSDTAASAEARKVLLEFLPGRRFYVRWASGRVEIVTADFFSGEHAYPSHDVLQILALEIGAVADLSDLSGDHFVTRLADVL